jgi:hypothetical protein
MAECSKNFKEVKSGIKISNNVYLVFPDVQSFYGVGYYPGLASIAAVLAESGKKYDAIIMDPPSFGRRPKGEVWNIENMLSKFIEACQNILSDSPAFLLFTTHSPGFSA